MKRKIGFIVVLFGISSSYAMDMANCLAPKFTKDTAIELLQHWGDGALKHSSNVGGSDKYVTPGYFAMTYYTPDATLLPTVSPVQRYGTQDISNYFIGFLQNNPKMIIKSPEKLYARELGCGYGVASGYYDFILQDPKTNAKNTAYARFTFVYEYQPESFVTSFKVEDGANKGKVFKQTNPAGWYIDLQQSSLLPADNH